MGFRSLKPTPNEFPILENLYQDGNVAFSKSGKEAQGDVGVIIAHGGLTNENNKMLQASNRQSLLHSVKEDLA